MEELYIRLIDTEAEVISGWTPFRDLRFALCSRPSKEILQQDSNFTVCREIIVSAAKAIFLRSGGPYIRGASKATIDKTRVAVFVKQRLLDAKTKIEIKGQFEKALINAKKMLNFFEKIGNLEQTDIYRTRHRLSEGHLIYVFEGDKEWVNVPYLLSLYCLLIRCGRFIELGNFQSCDQFAEKCDALATDLMKLRMAARRGDREQELKLVKKYHGFPDGMIDDVGHLFEVADKIEILMKNREYLFGSIDTKTLYSFTTDIDGITRFCSGRVRSYKETDALTKKFSKLCKENGIKCDKPFPDGR